VEKATGIPRAGTPGNLGRPPLISRFHVHEPSASSAFVGISDIDASVDRSRRVRRTPQRLIPVNEETTR